MGEKRKDRVAAINQGPSREWVRLIRKLRRIGLESKARRLELALITLPAAERGVLRRGLGVTD